MSVSFDPYHKWLGILPKDQPPHHYRLLGLEAFEDDLQVIEAAADRQLGFLRKFQSGERAAECQKLLNEVTRARLCLLKPATKANYDEGLRAQLERSADAVDAIEFEPLIATSSQSRTAGRPGPVAWVSAGLIVLLIGGGIVFFLQRKGPDNNLAPQKIQKIAEDQSKADAVTQHSAPGKSAAEIPSTAQTLSPGQTEILPLLKSEHIIKGSWHIKPDRLESLDHVRQAQVVLPITAPAEYTLHVEGTRLDHPRTPSNACILGLVHGQHSFLFALDVEAERGISGLEAVDGKQWNTNPTSIPGHQTQVNQPFRLDAIIRQDGVEVRMNDRTIVDWKGRSERLSRIPGYWDLVQPQQLFLGAESKYVFTRVTLGPPLPPRKLPGSDLKPGESVELLKFVDIKKDVWNGDWLKDGLTMKSSADSPTARFGVPYQVPEEYELVADIQSDGPGRDFYLAVPFQSGHAGVGIGGRSGKSNALLIDYAAYYREPHIAQEGEFLTSKRNLVTATVRKNHLTIKVGNKTVFDWKGDPRRFVAWPEYTTPGNRVTVGSNSFSFRIHSLKLTRLAPSESFPKPAPPQNGDLLAIVNVDRDTTHGVWTKSAAGVLSSADRSAGLRFPAQLPADYDFRFVIERKAGNDSLAIALPIGGRRVQVVMDGWGGKTSGIDLIENRRANENSTTLNLPEPNFPSGQPTLVQGRVAGNHLTFEVNGTRRWDMDIPKTLADPVSLARPGWLTPQEALQVFLNSWESSFEVVEARFRPLNQTSPPFPPLNIAGLPKPATGNGSTPGGTPPLSNADQPLMSDGLLTTGTTPVPDAAAQAAALAKLREIFAAEYTSSKKDAEKLSLAGKLEKLADETPNDPPAKFVCLDEARKLSAEVGDLTKAFAVIEATGIEFKVDALEIKVATLKNAAPRLKGPLPNKELVDRALPLIDQLMLAEQFQPAVELAAVAVQAAVKVKDKGLQSDTADVRKEAEELAKEFAVADQARTTLQSTPKDAAARLIWGRWLCLRKNQWEEGLKLLQGAGDDSLTDLATRDLKSPAQNEEIIQLGTDWLTYAKSRKDHSLAGFATRALYWLSNAHTSSSGLLKTRIESLMEQAVSTRDWNSPLIWLLEAVDKKVAQRKYVLSQETRHDDGQPFQDLPPDGGVLIGFNCRVGGFYQWTVIKAVQPVYATKLGIKMGDWHGQIDGQLVEIRAREGYAVCDIAYEVGGAVDAIRIAFARITRTGLDPQRGYFSNVIGSDRNPTTLIRGALQSSQPIVGIYGHADGIWRGFGVVSAK